ncbi:response regulator transcription factor [Tessaracoccus sp.]|uniref:response regulator transcription factor n=1 Tax=Tessaracoccus sp. TaxID=1971211 RepID=UPI00344D43B4
MSGPPIRVLVADDQPLIRYSLRALVGGEADLEMVGEAATGREAVRAAVASHPDVVLMDIRMPDGDGIDATRAILADPASAGCRVLVVSMFELDEYVYAALRAGASGFLLKDTEPDRLLEAIRRTHDGESLFAPSVLSRLVAHYVDRPSGVPPAPPALLTPREVEVLTLVGRGLTNHEVAAQLVISVKTVKTHIGSLLAKLQARDRAQLVIAAYEAGLVGMTRRQDRRDGTFEA